VYPKVAAKNFLIPFKATLLDPVASCFNDFRKASHQGKFWGFHPCQPEPHRSHVQWDARRGKIGKMFPLGERSMQSDLGARQQWVTTGNQWVTPM
jgi:hypothetical protein